MPTDVCNVQCVHLTEEDGMSSRVRHCLEDSHLSAGCMIWSGGQKKTLLLEDGCDVIGQGTVACFTSLLMFKVTV